MTVAYRLENLHYSLSRYVEDGVAGEKAARVLSETDFESLANDCEEADLLRLCHVLESVGTAVPGTCDEPLAVVHRRLGYAPGKYYVRCLLNWKKTKSDLVVHFQNVGQLTDFGGEARVRLRVDMEARAADALRAIATVFVKTSPEKTLRLMTSALKGMRHPIDHLMEGGSLGDDGTDGECLCLRLFAVVLGRTRYEGDGAGLCQEHDKLFRRAGKVAESLRQAKAELGALVEGCGEEYLGLQEAYQALCPPKTPPGRRQ